MKNMMPSPDLAPLMPVVAVLECPSLLTFDRDRLAELFVRKGETEAEEIICRILEDLAERLNSLQGPRLRAAFAEIDGPAQRICAVADQIGLSEIARAASHVATAATQRDGIAVEATITRLERAIDPAIAQVWNFRNLL